MQDPKGYVKLIVLDPLNRLSSNCKQSFNWSFFIDNYDVFLSCFNNKALND